MAINKPNVPSAELPDDWGGTQTPYTEQQAQEGYPEAVPTVIDGGNLNYEKRGIFQHIKYFKVFADWLRNIPIGKIPVVNSKGQLDYDDPVTDSEVVHITGDETIDGVKAFNRTVLSYNPINAFNSLNKNITRGTAPTSGQNGFLTKTSDKYNTNLAGLYYMHTIENKNSLSMFVYDPTKSSGYDQVYLRLGYSGSGAFTETVKPANNASQSSANIATVGWVNNPSASLNVVHRTGDETIEGMKKFKSYLGSLYVRFTGADSMTAPSSDLYSVAIRCEDKNGKNTGNFRNLFLTNGTITTDMQVCREINGTAKFANMGIRMSNTGVVSTTAPTPPSGDNSTQIATTTWVKTELTAYMGIPDYASGISSTEATYTCPDDGWLYVQMMGLGEANTWGYAYINGAEVGCVQSKTSRSVGDSSIFIPVLKGDVLTFDGNINTGLTKIFYPFK